MLRDLAFQRIMLLLSRADEEVYIDEGLARRYVYLALRLASKARIRIPRDLRRKFCRKCYTPLIPGFTARYRIRSRREKHLVVTCLRCGYIRRYPLRKK